MLTDKPGVLMHSKYSFEFLNDQLLNCGAVHSAAELHGMLSGLISAGRPPGEAEWIDLARNFLDLEDRHFTEEQQTLFNELLELTLSHFGDDSYPFSPMLPCDEALLSRRAEELGAWCSGFLHGLGRVLGENREDALSPEVAEAMRDIANICQIHVDQDDSSKENEGYWGELVAYVKVAVLTVYSEYKSDKGEPTVH